MNKFQVFILLLLSSTITANACGYYPYGEDVRFCFFRPELYGFHTFSEFTYSSNSFEPKEDVYNVEGVTPNEKLWFKYCKGKVPAIAIRVALYEINSRDIVKASGNAMIRYLYNYKDVEAINYLKFAKKCELLNRFYEDPWERNDYVRLPQRTTLYNEANALAAKTVNKELKLRYKFLAIRMAFYNGKFDKIRELHNAFFAQSDKNILYYWSLYFNTLTETDKTLANFYAAQVFANAPDKRFAILSSFDTSLPLNEVLKYAGNDKEKANVYLLAGIRKPNRALTELQGIYSNDPSAVGLSFLLLREVNKLEDWVYTPYYSLFTPSTTSDDYTTDSNETTVLNRVEKDRLYAANILAFINKADLRKVNNAPFWQMAKAQLELITKQYANCLHTIAALEKSKIDDKSLNQLQLVKAMALTASQNYASALLLEDVKAIILKNKGNQKFLFSIGRELEYKGNTNDAALLYSKLTDSEYDIGSPGNDNTAYWQAAKNKTNVYSDYYTNYFDYINIQYTPAQVENLIVAVKSNKATDDFSVWEYSGLKNEITNLYDLLGTKYIRQNNLKAALASFKNDHDYYWQKNYGAGEKNQEHGYGNVFDKNPFYDIKYTPAFIPTKDTIALNKYTVTRQLIAYLDKANNIKERDRDYYYFLVANCYYNMTQYGNSWMMRRFFWSSSYTLTSLEDEAEYRQSNMAKSYYTLALKHAKTRKFRALCLRMIALCDANRLAFIAQDSYPHVYPVSPYYGMLKKRYPEYFSELTTNCTAFGDYFKARR